MRTRVKICGITRAEDAKAAIVYGCDAIGLVFYEPSPRYVSPDVAAVIAAQLPPFVDAVGLFVDESPEYVREVLAQLHLDLLQFHGDESPEYCRQFGMPYIKAVRVRPETNLLQYAAAYADAKGLLLDTFMPGTPGGTGQTFDWTLIPENFPKPIILAGGLDAGNVSKAIRQSHPFAVDVSGGVEREKGIKDADKIAAFMRGVLDGQV